MFIAGVSALAKWARFFGGSTRVARFTGKVMGEIGLKWFGGKDAMV